MTTENEPLRILSLGAGVQSSCLALRMAAGELPSVDLAIFADTQAEPRAVYEYLAYVRSRVPFEVVMVTAGNLEQDFLAALDDPAVRCGQPPFMVYNREKDAKGRLWRKCTGDYKITPIRRKARARMKAAGAKHIEQIIGISVDEAHRMKPSGVRYISNVYPLVEEGFSRQDCLQWMRRHGHPTPPKSACYFCPYMDNARLRDMRDNAPEEWQRLVWFDGEMRARQKKTINGARITGELYVHRDAKPIPDVDLRTAADVGQLDMFGEECEGMCGL